MRDLSMYVTVAPIHRMEFLEVERSLLRNFRPLSCRCVPPDPADHFLGKGVAHAFNSLTGRMRLVSSIATEGKPEGEELAPSAELSELAKRANELEGGAYEWWSLAGPSGDINYDDFDTKGTHRIGISLASLENELGERARSHRKSDFEKFILTRILIEITESVNRIAFWHGIDPVLTFCALAESNSPFDVKTFIQSMPTRHCLYVARSAKCRNSQWPWTQHDYVDMTGLCGIVPYVDVVVTERQWAHVFNSSGVAKLYGTKVISRLGDLPPMLQSGVPVSQP